MEPRIQYCTASDGVSIAFSVMGTGFPYVLMPSLPWSHIERMWQIPMVRRFLERSAQKREIVQYDNRGSGLSERGISDFSLEAHLMDLHAVVDHLGLERFDLSARQHSGPVAITYAARNPDRVSHLVLVNTYARASDYFSSQQQAVHELAEKDWGLFMETAARFGLGWANEEMAKVLASLFRESVSQDVAVATYRAIVEFDTSSLLAQVNVPTLVVHDREIRYLDLEVSKGIAARIPGARLSIVEGLFEARIGDAVDAFLDEGAAAKAEAEPQAPPSALRTVIFTDLVGHTEMMQRLGDERGRAVLREHETITRDVLKRHGGTEVKTMGDGFMASFGSVTKAVECAVALQRAFAEREGEPLSVRVGLNAGEPIEEDGDLFGATVILASRIAAKADGGEILVADTVRGLCSGKGFVFADRGEFVAKGFAEPVRVYEVGWQEDATETP
jgi:class 3 adenylate cyclase